MKKYELIALYHQLYRDDCDNIREYRDTSDNIRDNIREYRDTSDNIREYRDTSDNIRDTSDNIRDNIREYRDTSDNISEDNVVNYLGLLEKYTTPYELDAIELYPSYSWNEYEL